MAGLGAVVCLISGAETLKASIKIKFSRFCMIVAKAICFAFGLAQLRSLSSFTARNSSGIHSSISRFFSSVLLVAAPPPWRLGDCHHF